MFDRDKRVSSRLCLSVSCIKLDIMVSYFLVHKAKLEITELDQFQKDFHEDKAPFSMLYFYWLG